MNPNQLMQAISQLKQRYGAGADPNAIIQQMMQSGQISQSAYDNAVRQVQQMQSMFTPSAHRR
jgi:predicted negative regulator of RcsB-dependent stress response